MKKYIVSFRNCGKYLENILKYLRYNLAGDIIADKYKLLFKKISKYIFANFFLGNNLYKLFVFT